MSTVLDSSLPQGAATPRPGSGAMFDRIAGRYDFLNRVISLGLDHRWRRHTVRALEPQSGGHYLDLATGTADVLLSLAEHCSRNRLDDITMAGLDPSAGMLKLGEEKIRTAGLDGNTSLHLGEAEELPFDDNSFEGVSISFGIRNVADRPAALREMARVTKPGGRIAILEGSEPRGLLGLGARFHLRVVVPRLGAWLSGAPEYRYLQTSIAAFPPPDTFAELMEDNGLEVLDVHPMTFGAVHLYVAQPKADARPKTAKEVQS